jgi:hypothetical protein
MTDDPGNSNGDAAIQYLVWAIELIEKDGDAEAACHARAALKRLKAIQRPRPPIAIKGSDEGDQFTRSRKHAEKVMRLASAPDPEEAVEQEREKARTGMSRTRSGAGRSGSRGANG